MTTPKRQTASPLEQHERSMSQEERDYLAQEMQGYTGRPAAPPIFDEPAPAPVSGPAPRLLPAPRIRPPAGIEPAPPPRRGPAGIEYQYVCPCGAKHWAPRNAPTHRCPPCADKFAREREHQSRAEDVRKALVAAEASLMEHGKKYSWARFDAPELAARVPRPVKVAMVQFYAPLREQPLMFLVGGTGAGKTTLGTAVFRWHLARQAHLCERFDEAQAAGGLDRAWSALWVPAAKLAANRSETPLGQKPALLEAAMKASLLLVDDLGQEAPQHRVEIKNILDAREAAELPTVVTYGQPLAKLAEWYGAHLERRLTEATALVDLEEEAAT